MKTKKYEPLNKEDVKLAELQKLLDTYYFRIQREMQCFANEVMKIKFEEKE